jgi:hypothetical protein
MRRTTCKCDLCWKTIDEDQTGANYRNFVIRIKTRAGLSRLVRLDIGVMDGIDMCKDCLLKTVKAI